MCLLEEDEEYLKAKRYEYEATPENSVVNLVIKGFTLPPAYNPSRVDLLIRLPPGYPQGHPDMFWTDPHVQKANGGDPNAASVEENYIGRKWQRWSRHWSAPWRPGTDGLHTFIAATIRELAKGQ
jgi:hypothetical protein